MNSISRVALQILRQNRWLLLLLALWPIAISIFLQAQGKLDRSDVQALLMQEGFYGIALTAFQGGALLPTELKSKRIIQVLSCGISRGDYLFALFLATLLPLALYLGGFVFAGLLLDESSWSLFLNVLCVGVIGISTGCAALLFSIFLPSVLSAASSILILVCLCWFQLPPFTLVRVLQGGITAKSEDLRAVGFDLGVTLIESCVWLAMAWLYFQRTDLNLKTEE